MMYNLTKSHPLLGTEKPHPLGIEEEPHPLEIEEEPHPLGIEEEPDSLKVVKTVKLEYTTNEELSKEKVDLLPILVEVPKNQITPEDEEPISTDVSEGTKPSMRNPSIITLDKESTLLQESGPALPMSPTVSLWTRYIPYIHIYTYNVRTYIHTYLYMYIYVHVHTYIIIFVS